MKDSYLKFLFLGVLFVLVLIGRIDVNQKSEIAIEKEYKASAVVLTAQPKLKNAPVSRRVSNIIFSEFEPVIALPRRDLSVLEIKLDVVASFAKDLDTDANLHFFNINSKWPLASLTKLMTAIIAIENVGLDKKITISEFAVETEGVSGDLEAGEVYAVGELIKAMLVVSSNDAAVAIAEFYGKDNFVKEMQSKAYFLEMYQTIFADPTGISSHNQGSIADLEKLVKYIIKKHPSLFKISAEEKVTIFEETKNIEKELLNINSYSASRPYFLGGKTGFTDEAHGNLISLFSYDGHRLLLIVLGTEDRFEQTDLLYNWIKSAFSF